MLELDPILGKYSMYYLIRICWKLHKLYAKVVHSKVFEGKLPSHIGRKFRSNGKKQIRVGDEVEIGDLLWVSFCNDKGKLKIGRRTYIGRMCTFAVCDEVVIGDSVLISDRVYIGDIVHSHREKKPIRDQEVISDGKVYIGSGSWLGIGCSILPGVKIGDNVVVGANSVVTKDIPNYCTVVGVPARVISRGK